MIIENVAYPAGRHCETTTLGALLRHAGVDLSEPMLFGLGEGLSFVYWDARSMDFPFLGGRTKPTAITRTVADRLGLTLHIEETASPVGPGRTSTPPSPPDARSACNWTLTTWPTSPPGSTSRVTSSRCTATTTPTPTHRQPRPPWHRQGGQTGDHVADPRNQPGPRPAVGRGADGKRRDRRRPLRSMYRDFLAECATIVDDDNLRLGHQLYSQIAPLWTEVSRQITAVGETSDPDHLTRASAILTELAASERHAMQILTGIRTHQPPQRSR